MAGAYSVALVGFSASESAAFESLFRLVARRPLTYSVQDEVMDAQILIVNADNAQALHLVKYAKLPGRVLLVGHNDGGTRFALLRRPFKQVECLAALDKLVGMRQKAKEHAAPLGVPQRGAEFHYAATEILVNAPAPLAPAFNVRKRSPDSDFPLTRPMLRERAEPPVMARTSGAESPRPEKPGVVGITDSDGLDALPTPPAAPEQQPNEPRGDVLLVAENLVEGRILHKRFTRYGLIVDWSREAQQALVMLQAHAYHLVVIDRLQGGTDAYSVCRSAKQRKRPNGQSPVVVMFAPTAGSMDRIKAGLAGCDAYLSRAVGEVELYRLLAKHRLVNLHGFEDTNIGF